MIYLYLDQTISMCNIGSVKVQTYRTYKWISIDARHIIRLNLISLQRQIQNSFSCDYIKKCYLQYRVTGGIQMHCKLFRFCM